MDEYLKVMELCWDKPPEAAVDFLKMEGFVITDSWKDQLDIIKQHAFTVSKITTADKLQKILNALQKAMDEGKTYEDFKKEMEESIDQKINWNTVYRTNNAAAYNTGRFVSQLAATESHPYWMHNCPIDSRTRPLGRALNGLIYKYDDPHWNTYYPPNEYNDRDRISTVTQKEIDDPKNKLKVRTDPPEYNKQMIEPMDGFRSNPATSRWKPDLSKYHPDIRKQVQKALKQYKEVDVQPVAIVEI